jgi:hypothetical protein
MKYKKIMLILITAIFLASIAGVCAADANDTIVANENTNQIELSWEPQEQFDVRWNKNGFDIFSGATKIAAWCWKIDSKIGFRGSNSGNSSVYEENNSGMSIFSKKELFYLQ